MLRLQPEIRPNFSGSHIWPSLLLRRFVFLIVEASAKREGLVRNRKGPPSRLPLRAHFHRERETSGYEAVNSLTFVLVKCSLRPDFRCNIDWLLEQWHKI